MHDIAVARGAPLWHGGMLESGIGRAHNIHLSTLPGFTLPGDVAASRRYFAPDLIDPEIDVRPDGTIPVPGGYGIGVHVVEDRVNRASIERLELRATG
jgi:O-succinylbenzoate synthase